jgi:glycosyltransferase involved in cell wall biosynthesis
VDFALSIKEKPKTDEWYTPRSSVEPIIPYAKGKVWCPFDTEESYYVKCLQEHGIECEYTHINNGVDFFKYEPKEYDCIISNPPYSKRNAVLDRLYELNKPFAILLNMNGIFDSKCRFELFKRGGVQLFIPNGRTNFFQADGIQAHPSFQAIYVCRNLLPRDIVFAD